MAVKAQSSEETEDKDMFSVFVNRTQTRGYPSTIGAVATQPGKFTGYNNSSTGGPAKYYAALNSPVGSSLCDDLTYAVDAMDFVLTNGSQLGPTYLFWKAIWQGGSTMHTYRPGDIYVANTAFGTSN
jgi:hypothetical protein